MKKVPKRNINKKEQQALAILDLEDYRNTNITHIRETSTTENFQAPLSHVFTVAAFMLSPLTTQSQCIINAQSIDVNRDGNPDLMFYTSKFFNDIPTYFYYAHQEIEQLRAKAINSSDQLTFFGTQFFPRSCYMNSCVFPTPNGALSGINNGSVAVLREEINTCYLYTYSCTPIQVNGNFDINNPQELGFRFNSEDHFIELTINYNSITDDFNGVTIHKIDGAIAEPCDGGCQDTLKLTYNEIFPIDSYHAQNVILANDIVDMNQMVELAAGSEIEMLPGFELIKGGEILANIDPNCN